MSEMAIRHPKRGKAHRQHGAWQTTVCKPNSVSGFQLFLRATERIPVDQTAPEDRCKKCWPQTPQPAPGKRG